MPPVHSNSYIGTRVNAAKSCFSVSLITDVNAPRSHVLYIPQLAQYDGIVEIASGGTIVLSASCDLAKGQCRVDFEANDDLGMMKLLWRIVKVGKINNIAEQQSGHCSARGLA